MSDLGQQLKEARLARGLSLDDIQEITKIRKRYLEAIESGDYKVLPGSFYVRAFIKTYAEAVGLDADELLSEHRQNVPAAALEPTMEPVIQKRRSKQHAERNSKWLSTTLMWSFMVLILVVIYLYFTWGKSDSAGGKDQTDDTPVTQQANNKPGGGGDNGAGDNGAAGDEVQSGDNAGTGGNQTDGDQNGGQTGDDTTDGKSTDDEGNGTDTDTGTDSQTPQEIVIAPDGVDGSTTKFKVQNAGNTPVNVVITATGRSWVEVRKGNNTGEKLYFANTSDGDVLTYPIGPEGLYIVSGNSPKTTITVGGKPVDDGKNTSRILLNLDTANDGGTVTGGINDQNTGINPDSNTNSDTDNVSGTDETDGQ